MATSAELLNDVSQILPNIFIEQINIESIKQPNIVGSELSPNVTDEEKIRINITLSLKDIIEEDGVSQWFMEQDMQKYIKVKCLLVRNETFLDDIYSNEYTYQTISKKISSTKTMFGNQLKDLDIKIPNGIQSFINVNDKNENELTIPLSTSFETTLKGDDPFVAILAFPTFNLKEFSEKFGISGVKEQNAMSRNFSSEIIMRDGLIVSEKQYFIIEETGEFYYSQFHAEKDELGNDVFRTGLIDGEGLILKLQTEPNSIVNDLRVRKKFGNFLQLDETSIVNNFFKGSKQISKVLNKTKINDFSKYFSSPFITLDEKGNSRFTFFFDKANFILDNCFYKPILEPNKIAKDVKVLDVSVYRIRKDINEINAKSENNSVFVAKNGTANSTFDRLLDIPLNNNNGYVTELPVNGNTEKYSIKSYAVYDTVINKTNYGLYKYKVVLNVLDPTIDSLKNVINSITKNGNSDKKQNGILPNLQDYYDVATSSRRLPPQNFEDNLNIRKSEPYFNILTGKFSKFLEKENKELIEAVEATFNDFINVANVTGYIDFNNKKLFKDENEKNSFINSLRSMILPQSASPESIKILISVVQDFVNYLKTNFNFENKQAPSKVNKSKSNTITIEYEFDSKNQKKDFDLSVKYDEYFNASFSNGVGFKIIQPTTTNNLGLNSITLKDYKSQTNLIVDRYFNQINTINLFKIYGSDKLSKKYYDFDDNFDNDDSRYAHLPISIVSTLGNKYDINKLTDVFSNQQFYIDMLLDIVNYNTTKLANFNNQSEYSDSGLKTLKGREITNAQLLDIFSDPSFVSISTEEINNLATVEDDKKNQGSINTYGQRDAGSNSSKQIDNQARAKQKQTGRPINSNASSLMLEILLRELIGEQEQFEEAKNVSYFNPLLENGDKNPQFFLDQKALQLFLQKESTDEVGLKNYFVNLPLPLKYLAAVEKSYLGSNNVENFFKFWISFKKLYTIQYFDGFEIIDGKANLKKPIWKNITIQKLENARDNIFCRIVKYKPDDVTNKYFPEINKLELPLFDEYFYIVPDDTINLDDAISVSIPQITRINIQPLRLENPKPDRGGPVSSESIRSKKNERDAKEQARQETKTLNIPSFNFSYKGQKR